MPEVKAAFTAGNRQPATGDAALDMGTAYCYGLTAAVWGASAGIKFMAAGHEKKISCRKKSR